MSENTSKYKLKFTLKQHTPIIHFQAHQTGATLRATELKPKFDRFLITQLGDGNYEKGKEKAKSNGWLIGKGEHPALDYKVRIDDKSLVYVEDEGKGEVDYKIYMGNIDGNVICKKMDNNHKKSIEFKSFKSGLIEEIGQYFPSFMIQTNFGRAQSKGFGCYTVEDYPITFSKNVHKFTINTKNIPRLEYKVEKLYTHIYYFYKLLKSGINEYGANNVHVFYGKSLLWKYAKEKLDATWDKKLIKQHYFNNEHEKHLVKHRNSDILTFGTTSKNEYLLRDLLGYSNSVDWDGVLIRKSNDNIDRFKSPIRFKPIITDEGYDVYFWAETIPSEMLNAEFTFDVTGNSAEDLTLKTPDKFDADEYLDFIHTVKIDNHIDKSFQSAKKDSIFHSLSSVFSSLVKVETND